MTTKKEVYRYVKPALLKTKVNSLFYQPDDLLSGSTCCCGLMAPDCYECIDSPFCICNSNSCAI